MSDLIPSEAGGRALTLLPPGRELASSRASDWRYELTELLLSGGVPNVEADGSEVCGELKRVDLDTKGGWRAGGDEQAR